jgi:hypothetical protein
LALFTHFYPISVPFGNQDIISDLENSPSFLKVSGEKNSP